MTTHNDSSASLARKPALFVIHGPEQGAVFALRDGYTSVGRDEGTGIGLIDATISREHARFVIEGDGVYVEDLWSRNGTFVNQRRIECRTRLAEGDYVRFGRSTTVKFSLMGDLEKQALRTLYDLTLRDPLTHLYNRRYFDERLHSEFSYARRNGAALALLLVDIDHFKDVNDTWGHPAGDGVLKAIATRIRRMTRPEDVLARYGGEEFVIIARGTSARSAQIIAERIRRAVEELPLPLPASAQRVTVSIGIASASLNAACASPEALVGVADGALYRAKHEGRNRVCVMRLPETPSKTRARHVSRAQAAASP